MKQILITGGAGFLGQRLATALLNSNVPFSELVLVDVILPVAPVEDSRICCVQADLTQADAAQLLITQHTAVIFHLAAVVSSHAESDFDLGYHVNLDVTRYLLEGCRMLNPNARFVFASSLAVYGGKLPAVVDDLTAVMPGSSYGTQKAMAELLVNDYSRKGFVDGRVLRLPTICVRPGKPNKAASSFLSSIIREPLNGQTAICPVSPGLGVWLCSPYTIIENLMLGAVLQAGDFDNWRTVNLPGISVTVQQMLNSLTRVGGKDTAALVRFEYDATINGIVSSWPALLDNTRAMQMGFKADEHFDEFIRQHLRN